MKASYRQSQNILSTIFLLISQTDRAGKIMFWYCKNIGKTKRTVFNILSTML